MNSSFKRILVGAAIVAGGGLVLFVGANAVSAATGGGGMFGWNWGSMMGGNGNNQSPMGPNGGMMGGQGYNQSGVGPAGSMMGYTGTLSYGAGMMSNGNNMMSGGMMGTGSSSLLGVKPLTVDQATSAVNGYLKTQANQDLMLAEVMIFDNNAYARITEKSTGAGAFELLVNPATQAVYPEPGPNMMWNAKYSPMRGMMGGMMGGTTGEVTTAMPVSAADALKVAQTYLDKNLPGAKTAADADPFYGYYTIDILRDGKVAGMLSVNGYSSQVFLHTWHGNFIEMSEGK
jgi:hypothetical protein